MFQGFFADLEERRELLYILDTKYELHIEIGVHLKITESYEIMEKIQITEAQLLKCKELKGYNK